MTTSELIADLLKEYLRRKESGEPHHKIKDFYSLFFIDKHLSLQEKENFCTEAIFEALEYFKAKRKSIIENNEEVSFNDLYDLTKEVYPYQVLFQYSAPTAAQKIDEDQIISFLEYYDSKYSIKVYNESRQEYEEADVSNHLLYHSYVLDFVIYFLKYNPISDKLKRNLEALKSSPALQRWERQSGKIDGIIKGEGEYSFIKEEEKKDKELSAEEIATGKKWARLRENELTFIDQNDDFYALVEALSKINYFNKHEVKGDIKDAIDLISPKEYEVFVLDIYHETKSEGNKRSSWFVGEKVIAFRIFVWLMHYLDTSNQYSILSKLAEKCFTKIPRVGPTSRKLGDVVLRILSESETIEGLGVLLNLKARAKYPVFREALNDAIVKAINYTKLDPNEVEDFFINDFELQDGIVDFDFGDFSSKIEVESFSKVNLQWFKQDGKTQKSVPALVKSTYPAELKLWKAKHKDIKKELSGQKQRIEGFWRKKKKWAYANWEKYILNHELIRFIARNLIWQFDNNGELIVAIWENGNLVDTNGSIVGDLSNSSVTLWHPCESTVLEVQSWRNYILAREIKQAFKQAFREIYLVTDAERTTSTYSNRFLNHIVRHHKFAALAKQRIWTYANVFAQDYPFIDYAEDKIKATFDLENNYELATTGRVHFRDTKRNEAMIMDDIPSIIFSETMRDVDLFVGVCSIGIEEEWNQNQHMNYWRNYSTSDLSETAKTRRSVLENMLPKLKIKEQCELTEKYLKVKGKVRSYKIHLGSGNILMEPNDQYLCIVPDSTGKGKADRVFLPFDDDVVFSIILSKAFLLAEDDKIEDQVILNQIKR